MKVVLLTLSRRPAHSKPPPRRICLVLSPPPLMPRPRPSPSASPTSTSHRPLLDLELHRLVLYFLELRHPLVPLHRPEPAGAALFPDLCGATSGDLGKTALTTGIYSSVPHGRKPRAIWAPACWAESIIFGLPA
jgi:hypothetical protein